MNCNKCQKANAVMILTSIQCPHTGCVNYNQSWSVEVGMKSFQFENSPPTLTSSGDCVIGEQKLAMLHIIGELKDSGFSLKEIAKRVNLSKASVCLYMTKYGNLQGEKQKSQDKDWDCELPF